MASRLDQESRRQRLDELRKKMHDAAYLDAAVLRIAQVLSTEIMNGVGGAYARKSARKR
jgi:hypothetical protein